MTTDNKFKVGDRVECTNDGSLGVIVGVDIDKGKYICNGYEVKFDNGDEEWIDEDMLALSDEPPYDRKKDFLTRLQSLMREFDAEIYSTDFSAYMSAKVGNEYIAFVNSEINADNIMDYEKE